MDIYGRSAGLLDFCDGFLLGWFDGLYLIVLLASCLEISVAISLSFLTFLYDSVFQGSSLGFLDHFVLGSRVI